MEQPLDVAKAACIAIKIHQNGEFTAFFVPQEVITRTIEIKMLRFDCDDNP